ncbi:unnamed protein product [Rodentolepis nana]|uniref:Ig-like domain-containing protein n=1 Tax=Rodentolepis nana TaxID=102285 RepID=A0A0R3TYD7_RODNA|nr:unnamed protein product [Rodentolepis nana]
MVLLSIVTATDRITNGPNEANPLIIQIMEPGGNGEDPPDVKPTGGNGEDPSDSLQEKMEKTHLIRCSPEEEMEKTHLIRCPALKTSTESQRYWYTGGNGEDPPDSVFKGGNGEDPPDSVSSGGNGDDPPDSVSSSKDNADPPDSVSSSKDKDSPP